MIARLAAIRLLPIRSRFSRYDNHPTTKAAAMATMPLPTERVNIAVRIENVRSIRDITQTPLDADQAPVGATGLSVANRAVGIIVWQSRSPCLFVVGIYFANQGCSLCP